MLLMDQKRKAIEYTHRVSSSGETIHIMYSNYIRPDGVPVIVGVMSNSPILSSSNKNLLKTLGGWGPTSYTF